MIKEELNNVFPFAHELALNVVNPVKAFQFLIRMMEGSPEHRGLNFQRGMLSGITIKRSSDAQDCMEGLALKSAALKGKAVSLYGAIKITEETLAGIIEALSRNLIEVKEFAYLSYGRGLDNLRPDSVALLIDELIRHGAEGYWASLEIISMYQHGRPQLEIVLADRIKALVTSPMLLERSDATDRDEYHFEQLTLAIIKHFGVDGNFASKLSEQFVRLCQEENDTRFSALARFGSNCHQAVGP